MAVIRYVSPVVAGGGAFVVAGGGAFVVLFGEVVGVCGRGECLWKSLGIRSRKGLWNN